MQLNSDGVRRHALTKNQLVHKLSKKIFDLKHLKLRGYDPETGDEVEFTGVELEVTEDDSHVYFIMRQVEVLEATIMER